MPDRPELESNAPIERTVILEDKTLARLTHGFTQVPNFLLRRTDLTPGAKLAYSLLLSYAWQDDFCYPAQERLAQDSGYSERQVRRTLVELREKGLITWKQRGLNRPNVYRLLPVFKDEGWTRGGRPGPDKMSAPDRTPMAVPDRTPTSAYKYSEKNTQHVHVEDSPSEGTDGFRPIIDGLTPSALRREPMSEPDRLDYLASLAAEEFRDPKPLSRRTYRRIAARLGETVFFEVLGFTREAARDGLIAGRTGAYFVGMAKKVARERGVDLGLQTAPSAHRPREAA